MQLGLIISLSLHIGLLAWALLNLQRVEPHPPMPETVAVSVMVVTPSEITRMKQGDENSKNLETKAVDKPSDDTAKKEAAKPKAAPAQQAAPPPPVEEAKVEPVKPPEPVKVEPPPPDPIEQKIAALPPEPTPAPVAAPPPGPTPEEQAALAAQLEAQRKAEEAKAKAAAKKKADDLKKKLAEEKRKKDEADKKKAEAAAAKAKTFEQKMAEAVGKAADDSPPKALLDKSKKPDGGKPVAGETKTATALGPQAGTKEGRDTVLSATERDMLGHMLQSQVTAHYRLPAGGGAVTTPTVFVRFKLKQTGELDGEPEVLQRQNTSQFAIAAEAAIRAIKNSVPFQLPPEKYAAWQSNTVEFDVSKMVQ